MQTVETTKGAKPSLFEVPGMASCLAWCGICGALGFVHRFRTTRSMLLAYNRGTFCGGMSFGVAYFASSKEVARDLARQQAGQERLRRAFKGGASVVTPVSPPAQPSSFESFVDGDGDRVTFRIDEPTGSLV